MPTLTCQHVITNVRRLLRDADPDGDYEHSDTVLLAWLVECYTDMVILKPSINTVIETFQLVPGVEQNLPPSGIAAVRALTNMGSDGATRGRVYTMVDARSLYSGFPDWFNDTADGNVQHIMASPEPNRFQVYPPQPDPAGYIALEYSAIPSPPVDINSLISVDDEYAPAITNYMVFRALSEDNDHPANRDKAGQFYQLYAQYLGVKSQMEVASRRRRDN